MQAIMTKYLGPTNFRGARIKAWAEVGQTFMPYQHTLNAEQNHIAAARKFARQWGWTGFWLSGGIDGGHVFVCLHVAPHKLWCDEKAFLADLADFCLLPSEDGDKVLDRPTKVSAEIDRRLGL